MSLWLHASMGFDAPFLDVVCAIHCCHSALSLMYVCNDFCDNIFLSVYGLWLLWL